MGEKRERENNLRTRRRPRRKRKKKKNRKAYLIKLFNERFAFFVGRYFLKLLRGFKLVKPTKLSIRKMEENTKLTIHIEKIIADKTFYI